MSGIVAATDERGVLRIELDRPHSGNSIDLDAAERLLQVAHQAERDDAVRAVLVVGAGSRFCTGGDVAAMRSAPDPTAYVRELATVLDDAFRVLDALAKPVVCGVHGVVAGAGVALMLSADLVVAEADCRFTVAYTNAGLTPDCGASWLLPRAIGQPRALELTLTNRVLSASEALDWGLVASVAPDARSAAAASATTLAAGPAAALGAARQLIRGSWDKSRIDAGRDEATTIAAMIGTADAAERIEAFFRR